MECSFFIMFGIFCFIFFIVKAKDMLLKVLYFPLYHLFFYLNYFYCDIVDNLFALNLRSLPKSIFIKCINLKTIKLNLFNKKRIK